MSTRLTAATITDEQIHELHERLTASNGEVYEVCRIALYAPFGSARREQARARCAEIVNTSTER